MTMGTVLKMGLRLSKQGYPYFVEKPEMPRIVDRCLNSVAYLYPSEAEAEDGVKQGGSGFFVGIRLGPANMELLCVVTNRHVVDRGSATVRVNTPDGRFDIIPLDGAKWHYHPDGDDIAVCPIGINTTLHQISSISSDAFLTKKMIEQYDVGVGDDTFVVGRFTSREGKARNIPSVRFGAIAQMPAEPIVLDGGIAQESYLIEARSIPGYSGSPVFFTIPPAPGPPPIVNPSDDIKAQMPEFLKMVGYNQKRQNYYQLGPWLLGIDYCHIYDTVPVINSLTGAPVANMHVRSDTGMMGVIPAWRLTDILEGPGIVAVVNDYKAAIERGKKEQDR
ncbi:trypsin-like peptidase domain-containing protein [Bradyrhizobium sp. 2S1]|uniref:trypsin-like peptidase domain-containing protein n=1 Tax=Bradyrhizobium sp. 2S1 TaxID=1404429 RepID=UPI00140CCAFA|nr:trypsin-like peptidase domain-containing protein [Bradyrhizobium sp. 2S1]MCK7672595.1 trypsin-like peptidase domain-containing protein [Bradyrhizobium sp. 2S1]MCK7673474.1 trypsin-like peptidase domain-containing protein [Bradyrhizobium sp. 2S1]